MAGKLHIDYGDYAAGDGLQIVPGDRKARSYAEGYNAQRNGAAQNTNPFGAVKTGVIDCARAWDRGWFDAQAGNPPTHVGPPTGVPQVAPPPPEPVARRSRKAPEGEA